MKKSSFVALLEVLDAAGQLSKDVVRMVNGVQKLMESQKESRKAGNNSKEKKKLLPSLA